MMRPASGTVPAAAPGSEVSERAERLTSWLRPGVVFPDWSVIVSTSARATLVEAAWDRRAWQGHTPDEDAVRRAILDLYRELGRAPSPEEIARRAETAPDRVGMLLKRLAGHDLIVLEDDEIIGAYPLTDRVTEHRVRLDGQTLYAMCAIDALGVGAMYRMDTALASRCRRCHAPVEIATGDDGRRLDAVSPAEAVVFAGLGDRTACAATSLCTTIAFFCSDAHLLAWQSSHSLEGPGFCLSIDEAFQVGRAIFGPVLASPASKARLETTS